MSATSTTSAKSNFFTLAVFAVSTLALGMLTAWFSFAFFPVTQIYRLPVIYPPSWMFWLVWLILYPCMGVSAGYIWLLRAQADVRGVLVFYVAILAGNFMFLPVSHLANGKPAILTLMDFNGVITAGLFGWLCSKYSLKAYYWSLPLIIWMPVTAIFKIMLWLAN